MKKHQKKTPAGRRRPWPRFLALQGKSKQTGPAGRWWGPAQQLCKSKHHTSSTRPFPKPVFGADPCRRKPCWRSQSRPLGAGASHMLAAPPPSDSKHRLQRRRQQRRKHRGETKNSVCFPGHLLQCRSRLPKQIPAQRWLGKNRELFWFFSIQHPATGMMRPTEPAGGGCSASGLLAPPLGQDIAPCVPSWATGAAGAFTSTLAALCWVSPAKLASAGPDLGLT